MKNVKYEIKGQEFIIEDYNNAKAFASFFPAIAGEWGKPMWVYYVNRGQSISCLGTKDKDGAIIEFSAANKAYRQTPTQGFRTFYKVDGKFYEPFQNSPNNKENKITQRMHITSYLVKLVDTNETLGIETTAEFYTLPNETFPALMKKLTIKNISGKSLNIECLDGLSVIIPYGTVDWQLKNMSRLAEGWYNGVFFSKEHKVPVYKLPVEPQDRPEVVPVIGGNFYLGYYEKKGKQVFPEFIIDPDNIFGEVRNFAYPEVFINDDKFKFNPHLTGKNKTPSAMGHFAVKLKDGESFTYNSVVAHASNAADIDSFVSVLIQPNYFQTKEDENKSLINKICGDVLTKSSLQNFDNYCSQNFIDNLLRGGYPISIGEGDDKTAYYVYSRIHGDMEREYNNFMILPEYFSQGNGNYRDVNQNRRSDIFFNQDLKDETIVNFMNLIQTDGFNPLKVLGIKFNIINKDAFLKVFSKNNEHQKLDAKSLDKIKKYIQEPTTLGSFFNFLEDEKINIQDKKSVLKNLVKNSEKVSYANHAEGYWSDHWHYNMDLIDNYLAIFPDKIDDLLLNNHSYVFYDEAHQVAPRNEKHVLFQGEPKQLNAVYLDEEKDALIKSRKENPNLVRTKFGKGEVYKTNLLNKLLSLLANKYSSLDPAGVGLEMETDKPNWCDALNGLPGIFGSSTAESFELLRLLELLKNSLTKIALKDSAKIKITEETLELLKKLEAITKENPTDFVFWDKTHSAKEEYRKKTRFGLSGNNVEIHLSDLKLMIDWMLAKVRRGLESGKVLDKKSGVVLTNIEYVASKYEVIDGKFSKKGNQCIKVLEFKRKDLPLFLEGPVHYLRLNPSKDDAKKLHKNILGSGLYDKKLDMIKINAPLEGVDMSTGRITIFTPGWLENESIWLHMEYKYMLELLRNNLAKEFFDFSKTALVPFMDPAKYGRSIFENSSFIVSSAHPEPEIHGQGFVSRLSGSTAEFVSMWLSITSGLVPFSMKNGQLALEFKPQIPAELFTTKASELEIYSKCCCSCVAKMKVPKNSFVFKFLAKTVVVYNNPSRKDTFGTGEKAAKIVRYKLTYKDGQEVKIDGKEIVGKEARDIRNGIVEKIEVELK